MSKKNDILKYWEEQIAIYPKLDIASAKILYNEILEETDEVKKHEKLNTLIKGTLYVVLNFIKRNKLYIIKTPKYDVGDIINTCNELWINAINDGALLEAEMYSDILNFSFCSAVSSALNETDFCVADLTVLNSKNFCNFLYEFIEFDKEHGSVSFEDFCNMLAKYIGYDKYIYDDRISDSNIIAHTYELALNIVEALKDENDDIALTKLKIDKFKYLFLEVGFHGFRVDMNRVYDTGFEDNFVDYYLQREIMEFIFSYSGLDDRKKDMLSMLFGVNGSKRYSYAEIADKYNLTIERVKHLEQKAFRFLRKKPEIMACKKVFK